MYKIIILIYFFLFTSVTNAKDLEIDINSGQVEPLPIAIADFTDSSGEVSSLGRSISSVITNNLVGSGQFKALETAAFIAPPTSPSVRPNFNDWKPFGIKALVTGAIKAENNNKIEVEFRLWDVVSETDMIGLRLTVDKASWRRVSHIISDFTFERLTGDKGYFDTRVVYISESGPSNARKKRLAIMDQDGANFRLLKHPPSLVIAPRFSPTTNKIIFTGYETGKPRVYLMDLSSEEITSLPELKGMSFAPRFSMDGSQIVLSMTENGNTDIFINNLASGVKRRLTTNNAIDTAPSFSPDGKSIVFESDRGGGQQLYIISTQGGDAKRISFGKGRYATPVWSPRGDLIAFTKIKEGKFHIGVMRVDGTKERLLTTSFLDEGPAWAPNGRVLMFFRETPGKAGAPSIYSIDISGRNLRKIKTSSFASDPNWSQILN